jgi:hypothetical protein
MKRREREIIIKFAQMQFLSGLFTFFHISSLLMLKYFLWKSVAVEVGVYQLRNLRSVEFINQIVCRDRTACWNVGFIAAFHHLA